MRLQEKFKKDLMVAMKAKDEVRKSVLRVMIGELGRFTEKEIPDDEVIKMLKKLIKAEREVLEKKGEHHSDFIAVVESYLPHQIDEAEIREWIAHNIDFSQFNSKLQAMGKIMAHFGSAADGNTVKKVLQGM